MAPRCRLRSGQFDWASANSLAKFSHRRCWYHCAKGINECSHSQRRWRERLTKIRVAHVVHWCECFLPQALPYKGSCFRFQQTRPAMLPLKGMHPLSWIWNWRRVEHSGTCFTFVCTHWWLHMHPLCQDLQACDEFGNTPSLSFKMFQRRNEINEKKQNENEMRMKWGNVRMSLGTLWESLRDALCQGWFGLLILEAQVLSRCSSLLALMRMQRAAWLHASRFHPERTQRKIFYNGSNVIIWCAPITCKI